MPKTPKAPITPTLPVDIRKVVESEDSFGHEMRVGGVIRSIRAITFEHAGTYTDPALGKPRQFDYRCWLRKEAACLSLAIECKSLSQSVGLAVCGTKRQEEEAFHDLIESRTTPEGPGFRVCGWDSATRRATRNDSIYPPGTFVGKSLVPIQSSNGALVRTKDSDVYDGWAQAISSAVELAESACSSAKTLSEREFFTAVLPVVVIPNDRLWQVVYDDSGSIPVDPAQVTECAFYVCRKINVDPGASRQHHFVFSHVHLFTLAGFQSFLSKMAVNEHAWTRLFTRSSFPV